MTVDAAGRVRHPLLWQFLLMPLIVAFIVKFV
jgi:hypothetical protein